MFLMGIPVSKLTLLSFCMMILSSFVAAWEDLYSLILSLLLRQPILQENHLFMYSGYIWMITNCFCSSAYVLEMRKRMKSNHFTDLDGMLFPYYCPSESYLAIFYNGLLGIPFLIICTLTMDNWNSENISRNSNDKKVLPIITILLSGIFSAGISYTSLWCVRVTSSTTYSMVGALNKLPISISGLIFFKTPATFSTVSAIILGFFSGILYTLEKI
ncbi:hypothetical protein PCK1_001670 [Pneumocystis canis]|nr:hypothetical protein PCK1_001670 [Pneumocystis canis]